MLRLHWYQRQLDAARAPSSRRRCQLLVWLLVVTGIVSGCGTPEGEGVARQDRNWPREVTVPSSMQEWLRQDGTDDTILEMAGDGVFTFAEYEQAMLAYVGCAEGYGWTLWQGYPRLTPWGEYQVKFSPLPQSDAANKGFSPSEAAAGIQNCRGKHWRGVGRMWLDGHQPSERELQEARSIVAACLHDQGLTDVSPSAGREEMLAAWHTGMAAGGASQQIWHGCVAAAEATHYVSGFGVSNTN